MISRWIQTPVDCPSARPGVVIRTVNHPQTTRRKPLRHRRKSVAVSSVYTTSEICCVLQIAISVLYETGNLGLKFLRPPSILSFFGQAKNSGSDKGKHKFCWTTGDLWALSDYIYRLHTRNYNHINVIDNKKDGYRQRNVRQFLQSA